MWCQPVIDIFFILKWYDMTIASSFCVYVNLKFWLNVKGKKNKGIYCIDYYCVVYSGTDSYCMASVARNICIFDDVNDITLNKKLAISLTDF